MIINKDKIIYNILITGSILAVVIASIEYSDSNKKLFNCNNFIITGCELINEENIKSQLEYLKNKSIFDINKNEIITKLINNDFISSAEIAILLPSTLIISILEIKPISIVNIGESNFIVDKNNNGFPYTFNSSKLIEIPIIYFNNINQIDDVFKEIEYKFIQNIYSNHYLLYKKIDQIRFLDKKLIVSFNNNSVYFDAHNYQNQTKYLSAFFNTLDSLNKNYYYEYIKFAGETIIVKEGRNI